jgi:predicted ATPase
MKLIVENLARIERAEIETKNLTIFVGKNGTNKSYMAHLVYGINDYFVERYFIDYEFSKEVLKYIYKAVKGSPEEYEENIKIITEKVSKVNLTNNYLQRLFNDKSIVKKLKVEGFLKVETRKKEEINKDDINNLEIIIKLVSLSKPPKNLSEFQIEEILEQLLPYIKKDLVYFPASRTGFILAFEEIIEGIFKTKFSKKDGGKLTKPVIEFLKLLFHIKSNPEDVKIKNENIIKLIDFLEKRIIGGKIIEKAKNDYLNFYFNPKGTRKQLELHLASSSSVEILPLIVFLKRFDDLKNKLLIIEEPEAHLHPKAQIEIARFLVMLVNLGANVVITTHSDYIISEVNNCIKLHSLKEIDKNKYEKYISKLKLKNYPDISLSPDKITTYLFKEKGKKVEVLPLKINKFGIEDENFEEVLDELLERSAELGELIDV